MAVDRALSECPMDVSVCALAKRLLPECICSTKCSSRRIFQRERYGCGVAPLSVIHAIRAFVTTYTYESWVIPIPVSLRSSHLHRDGRICGGDTSDQPADAVVRHRSATWDDIDRETSCPCLPFDGQNALNVGEVSDSRVSTTALGAVPTAPGVSDGLKRPYSGGSRS